MPAPRTLTPLMGGTSFDQPVANGSNVPADAISAVLNLTTTDVSTESVVIAWPAGPGVRPDASTLNPQAYLTIANAASVKVGTGGKVSLYNNNGGIALIADLTGYYRS